MPLVFVSAQPDNAYFHWQVKLQLHNFKAHGLVANVYPVFMLEGVKPTPELRRMRERHPNIRWYPDTRTPEQKRYMPSLRPHILAKFFAEHPQLAELVFYHDSDILFRQLPPFESLTARGDDVDYVSDTVSYIGARYLREAGARHAAEHAGLHGDDLLRRMAAVVGVPVDAIIENEAGSGGAQYLLKGAPAAFWADVELACERLYGVLDEYCARYPVAHPVQKWTADMWAVLWSRWRRGHVTAVHPELSFSWATDSMAVYEKHSIFHLAGATEADRATKFYKGDYIDTDVIALARRDPHAFDHVAPTSATRVYADLILEVAALEDEEERQVATHALRRITLSRRSTLRRRITHRSHSALVGAPAVTTARPTR
jgi:hypothetical protein